MECNRDEAIRAKAIAERKLLEKDYAGAKKFAMKAQNLFPGLEDLPQMLAALNVYISAETIISGEVDWYGILDVNRLADDETVKKQYRKLALMLHPDKNKSVGADGAFQLILEAWSLLSDKGKRQAYNQRRSSNGIPQRVPSESGRPSTAPSANGFHNFTNRATSKPKNQKYTVPPPSSQRTDTFWTICHKCKMHYEYLKMYLNSTLLCPNCRQPFTALETDAPINLSKSSSHQRNQRSSDHAHSSNQFGPGRNNSADRTPGAGSKEPSIAAKAASVIRQANWRLKREREASKASKQGERGHVYSSGLKEESPFKKSRGPDDDGNYYGGKILHQAATGNGGAGTGNSSGLRMGVSERDRFYGFSGTNIKFNCTRELTPLELRNMLVDKARVEVLKKLNEWSSDNVTKAVGTVKKEVKDRKEEKEKRMIKGHSCDLNGHVTRTADGSRTGYPSTSADATDKKDMESFSMNVPDPDFHDFDTDRTESSFGDNQIWAAYDDDDGMPRFYAFIHKVISRNPLKMKISWLNSRTNSEFGPVNWVDSGFSKTCGEFRVGKHEIYKSLNSFSHMMKWSKGIRGIVHIIPKRGDIWALYRNWSHDWNEQTPDEVIHKYDMVEVLDDYNEEQGVSVAPLFKVAGFKTVFYPHLDPEKVKRIPKEEMFRFSHQVPSYLLTGQEAQTAPKGCQELDPAATPLELLQVIAEVNELPVMENSGKVEKEVFQSTPQVTVNDIADGVTMAKEDEMENGTETKEEETMDMPIEPR